jgi:hypothetical protein
MKQMARNLTDTIQPRCHDHQAHWAFGGQTPYEMYFATAFDLPAELAAARSKARAARLVANRALACEVCAGQQGAQDDSEIPP